jgi:hypothetical protein
MDNYLGDLPSLARRFYVANYQPVKRNPKLSAISYQPPVVRDPLIADTKSWRLE